MKLHLHSPYVFMVSTGTTLPLPSGLLQDLDIFSSLHLVEPLLLIGEEGLPRAFLFVLKVIFLMIIAGGEGGGGAGHSSCPLVFKLQTSE